MASNPYVNHVELADGTMLMDIRDTTADAESVENGRVFYSASGARTIGAMPVKLDQVAAYVEYSDSGTYSVGDIRTHGGRIYRCNTAIAEAEEWDSAHWTEVTIGELLFGKADKVSGATSGHVATLDGNGNLVDSGKTLGVSVPANAVFTDTTYTFTDNNPTLAWGTQSKVATVGGVDIHVTLPANPNTDHYDWPDITNKPASYPGGCTGNAASATQWQTARSLWGNSVNGTADVNGTLLSPNGIKTGSRASGSTGSGVEIGNDGGIEIYHSSTPFIDFHYQASTSDYSVRLMCNSATNLNCSGTISAQGFTGNVTGNCSGSAGSVAWANVSSKPETATRWPAWNEVTSKPSTFPPEAHTHSYLPLSGGTLTGALTIAADTDSTGKELIINAKGTGRWQRVVHILNANTPTQTELCYCIGVADSKYNQAQIYFRYEGAGSASNRLGLGLHSQDDVLNILAGGNVGIGTTSPSTKLHVNGTVTATSFSGDIAWSNVSSKPDTATRWPAWSEVTGKPNFDYVPLTASGGLGDVSGSGSNYYFHLATLTVTSTYINRPVVFEVSRRGYGYQRLMAIFGSTNSKDPDIDTFATDGSDTQFWIKKASTSTWYIYGRYNEAWGNCTVHRITGSVTNNGVNVTLVMTNYGTSEPGGTRATRYWGANYADSAGSVAWGNVSDKPTILSVWSGKVTFRDGTADLASTIGSGKTIYSASYNGSAALDGFIMGCSGTKVYLAQIIPGSTGRIVRSNATNQPIRIIYA